MRVAVITGFKADLADPEVEPQQAVAADRQGAAFDAGVLVAGVAVVARLKALFTGLEVGARDGVTADGDLAPVGAAIGWVLVAVVALLIDLDELVAARSARLTDDDLLAADMLRIKLSARMDRDPCVDRGITPSAAKGTKLAYCGEDFNTAAGWRAG